MCSSCPSGLRAGVVDRCVPETDETFLSDSPDDLYSTILRRTAIDGLMSWTEGSIGMVNGRTGEWIWNRMPGLSAELVFQEQRPPVSLPSSFCRSYPFRDDSHGQGFLLPSHLLAVGRGLGIGARRRDMW